MLVNAIKVAKNGVNVVIYHHIVKI